jgi:hypothetical protein
MAYGFKVTTKQPIAGGKIPKGITVQVIEQSSSSPQIKTIIEAYNKQLGTSMTTSSVSLSYFTVEKV